ncbi:hypothetical protein ACFPK5_08295 [Streptomyces beijiangensis]
MLRAVRLPVLRCRISDPGEPRAVQVLGDGRRFRTVTVVPLVAR